MATTYDPIATQTVSAVASLTFSSIAATYTDLKIIYVNTATSNNSNLWIRFNGDTATNYSKTDFGTDGTTVAASGGSGVNQIMVDTRYFMSQTTPSFHNIDILSYAGSSYKTMLCKSSEDYNGTGGLDNTVGLWRSTAAITSVTLLPSLGTITGTATLYGILKA